MKNKITDYTQIMVVVYVILGIIVLLLLCHHCKSAFTVERSFLTFIRSLSPLEKTTLSTFFMNPNQLHMFALDTTIARFLLSLGNPDLAKVYVRARENKINLNIVRLSALRNVSLSIILSMSVLDFIRFCTLSDTVVTNIVSIADTVFIDRCWEIVCKVDAYKGDNSLVFALATYLPTDRFVAFFHTLTTTQFGLLADIDHRFVDVHYSTVISILKWMPDDQLSTFVTSYFSDKSRLISIASNKYESLSTLVDAPLGYTLNASGSCSASFVPESNMCVMIDTSVNTNPFYDKASAWYYRL